MVMENIYRHAEMGKDRVTAAADGTKEITFAALAATLAVIAIFLPVAFMTGVIGKYFLQFGVTLSVAVAISYIEAITLAPARCAQMLNVGARPQGPRSRAVGDRVFDALARGYACGAAPGAALPDRRARCSRSRSWSARGSCAKQLKQEMVPSQDQSRLRSASRRRSARTSTRPIALTKQAEAMLAKHPEVDRRADHGAASAARACRSRMVEPEAAHDDAAAVPGGSSAASSARSPALRVDVQDLSQQGFARQPRQPVEFTVRGSRLADADRARAEAPDRARAIAASPSTSTATTSSARRELAIVARPPRAPPTSASTSATSRRRSTRSSAARSSASTRRPAAA